MFSVLFSWGGGGGGGREGLIAALNWIECIMIQPRSRT